MTLLWRLATRWHLGGLQLKSPPHAKTFASSMCKMTWSCWELRPVPETERDRSNWQRGFPCRILKLAPITAKHPPLLPLSLPYPQVSGEHHPRGGGKPCRQCTPSSAKGQGQTPAGCKTGNEHHTYHCTIDSWQFGIVNVFLSKIKIPKFFVGKRWHFDGAGQETFNTSARGITSRNRNLL